jgi:hypothetical protein
MKPPNFRRGIYVIPTSLTILNLFFGFRAIIYATRGIEATTLGRARRRRGVLRDRLPLAPLRRGLRHVRRPDRAPAQRHLEFGKEYDSLADVVTFGAAPAVLVYAWGLHVFEKLGGGIAFLFLAAVSLRLARFNVQTGKTDYRYFVGLPSPAGALTLASMIFYAPAPVTDRRFAHHRDDPDGRHRVRDGLARALSQPEGPLAAERALADVLPHPGRNPRPGIQVAARVLVRRRDLLPRLRAAGEAVVDRVPELEAGAAGFITPEESAVGSRQSAVEKAAAVIGDPLPTADCRPPTRLVIQRAASWRTPNPAGYRLGIVNPLTLVGNEIKTILRERAFPYAKLALLDATGEQAGALTEVDAQAAVVAPIVQEGLDDLDLVFFCGSAAVNQRVDRAAREDDFIAIDLSQPTTYGRRQARRRGREPREHRRRG